MLPDAVSYTVMELFHSTTATWVAVGDTATESTHRSRAAGSGASNGAMRPPVTGSNRVKAVVGSSTVSGSSARRGGCHTRPPKITRDPSGTYAALVKPSVAFDCHSFRLAPVSALNIATQPRPDVSPYPANSTDFPSGLAATATTCRFARASPGAAIEYSATFLPSAPHRTARFFRSQSATTTDPSGSQAIRPGSCTSPSCGGIN